MSIISDALKKVEGNSGTPVKNQDTPQVELVDAPARSASAPLFSVWSIVLSTIMVLAAAILLLVTWHTNRLQRSAASVAATAPVSPPVAVTPVSEPEVPVAVTAPAPEPAPVAKPEPLPTADAELPEPVVPPKPVVQAEPSVQPESPPVETKPAEALPAPVSTSPAQPAVTPEPEPVPEPARKKGDDLVLTGVVYTPRVRMAHINGKILPEGAEIEGYRIVTVSRESVRLSKDDKFYILRLKR